MLKKNNKKNNSEMLNKRHHRTLILTHYFQIMTKREINQSGRFTETTL